jgi:CRISPR-associated protein Csx3
MVNLLPAVLVGGPPHAGKSVLFYQLTQALRDLGVSHHAIRACPDGEGNWFHEGDPDTVSKIRVSQGSEWPAAFVQRISQDLEHRCLPLLVDMGGKPKPSQEILFRFCTHAILLLRADKPEATQHWERLVAENNLLPLARLFSQQHGSSIITSDTPLLEGTLTGLERHAAFERSPLFDALVQCIATLFNSFDVADRERIYFEQAPTEIVLDLQQALRTFTATSNRWEPAMLAPLLGSLPPQTPLSVYGVGPNWLYAALAAYESGEPFYLFDPKLPFGWVQPARVYIGTQRSPEIHVEERSGEDATILKITFPSDRLEYFQPDPRAFPSVSTEHGLIIHGRVPFWLLTALVRLYQEAGVPWIAPFHVQTNTAVVAYSRIEMYQPGDALPTPML